MKNLIILFLSLGLTGCFICTKQLPPAPKEEKIEVIVIQPEPTPVIEEVVAPAPKPAVNETSIIGAVTFESDKADLKDMDLEAFDKLCQYLKETPSAALVIEGHTDNSGTNEHNNALSLERAQALAGKFVEAGVTNSIEVLSYGADKPVASNDTEEGRSANRRVDVYIKAAQEASAE